MKKAAFLFLLIWTFLMIQPAFAYFGGKAAYGTCSKKSEAKPACTKSKTTKSSCTKKKATNSGYSKRSCKGSASQDKGKCGTGCNPTLGCTSGNFYIHHHSQILLVTIFEYRCKIIVKDDNRIVKSMRECWHPPEA